jgi:hypothetical protein
MAVMTKYLLDKLMDHVLRGVPYAAPKTVYLALFTSDISPDGKGDEVKSVGYERQPVVFGNKLFQGYLKNSSKIDFNVASDSWGEVHELAVMEDKTGDKMLFHGSMTMRKKIDKGDRALINIGELVIRVDTVS